MTREEILREALEIVSGQREQDYGTPEDNFGRIAALWSVYLGSQITPAQVAVMMVLLKVGRVKTGPNGGTADCFVDMAGYAACAGEIATRTNDKEAAP